MGHSGKLALRERAQRLRSEGFSVRDIQKILKISHSTAGIWVRDISLTQKQLLKLYSNKKNGGLRGSIIAARNKTRKRKELIERIKTDAKKEIGLLTDRDEFIAGIALYLAEGDKTDKNVAFTNLDAKVIKFVVKWLRYFCKVPEDKFRCNLYIHDNLSEDNAKTYWSNLTNIALSQFRKSYIVKNNTQRFRKTKHEYGVLRITVSDVNLHRKIMGWISGIFEI